jgi:hypothetical protein
LPGDSAALVFEEPRNKTIDIINEEKSLSSSSTSIGGDIMIEPDAGFKVNVLLSNGDTIKFDRIMADGKTINIKGDDAHSATSHDVIQRGYRYNIQIVLGISSMSATATVEPWNDIHVASDTSWW